LIEDKRRPAPPFPLSPFPSLLVKEKGGPGQPNTPFSLLPPSGPRHPDVSGSGWGKLIKSSPPSPSFFSSPPSCRGVVGARGRTCLERFFFFFFFFFPFFSFPHTSDRRNGGAPSFPFPSSLSFHSEWRGNGRSFPPFSLLFGGKLN